MLQPRKRSANRPTLVAARAVALLGLSVLSFLAWELNQLACYGGDSTIQASYDFTCYRGWGWLQALLGLPALGQLVGTLTWARSFKRLALLSAAMLALLYAIVVLINLQRQNPNYPHEAPLGALPGQQEAMRR